MKPVLTIIGGGMGAESLLTAAAREAVEGAFRVYAPPRLADSLKALNPGIIPATVGEIRAALSETPGDTAVIVSGDVGFYSLSQTLHREFGDTYRIRTCNGLSSLQYLCGRMGIPYDGVKTVSLHGREGGLAGPVAYNRRVFALTGGKNSAEAELQSLCALGLSHVAVTVGEDLGLPGERIRTGTAKELAEEGYGDLTALLIENPEPADPSARLRDEDFVRGKAPMTKESVRSLTVARLAVRPGDTVWDIGAGTGSVSVALAYAARGGEVYAVERSAEALGLIRENRVKLGAYNVVPVEAEAPAGLDGLPAPDRVFLGGTGGSMGAVLRFLAGLPKPFALCVNTVTMESTSYALETLDILKFADIEVECVNIARAWQVGGYRMMRAQNPVHIIGAVWRP